MKTTTRMMAAFGFFCFSGCGIGAELKIGGFEVPIEDAVFLTETSIVDLDGDGDADDSVSSVSLFIRQLTDVRSDLCDRVAQVNAAQGELDVFSNESLVFIQATQFRLNQGEVPFEEGEVLSGNLGIDEALFDGAVQVLSLRKASTHFNILSEGFGTLTLDKLSDNSLNASVIDEFGIEQNIDAEGNVTLQEINSPLEGSIKRAKACPALANFVPKLLP